MAGNVERAPWEGAATCEKRVSRAARKRVSRTISVSPAPIFPKDNELLVQNASRHLVDRPIDHSA